MALAQDVPRALKGAILIVVVLQLFGNIASLYLPAINGDIIDRGVATGDAACILTRGAVMLATAGFQIACSIGAVYFGVRIAVAYGRDLRASIVHHVGLLSAREVGKLGSRSRDPPGMHTALLRPARARTRGPPASR